MIRVPQLKRHLHAEAMADRVLLIAEGRYFALSGKRYARVLSRIDGVRSADQIVDELQGELEPAEVYATILLLERSGHIEEASNHIPHGTAAFWNALGAATELASDKLRNTRVGVEAFGRWTADDFRAPSLNVVQGEADVMVALTDDFLQPGLEEMNARMLATAKPWLLVKPNGVFPWIGPLFRPGHTGCWECLADRLRLNREVEVFAMRSAGRPTPYAALPAFPPAVDAAIALAATELAKWLVTGTSVLDGTVVSLDTTTLETQRHALVRRPQCSRCGDAEYRERQPRSVTIGSVRKTFTADGGHRSTTPEEALARYGHHISPITGITPGLQRTKDREDTPLFVYVTGNNMATRYDSFDKLRRNLRSMCCGKGIDDAQARVSGLGEAIERTSGVFRGDEIRRPASYRGLGDAAIHPRDCMLFSDAQYRDRDAWNTRNRRLDMIPLPLDEEAELEWTPLWSLTRNEHRYLPTSYLYYSYPSPAEQFYCLPDSNGCASGATMEEAMLQGFLELVERDCVAMWWYNRLRRPAVDLDSFDDPFIRAMQRYYASVGRSLWVLDLTNDLGIPAFIAVSHRTDGSPTEDIIFAPAAHLEARLGIVRAITELNQMMPGVARTERGDYAYDDPEAVAWWKTATIDTQPYLLPADAQPIARRHYPTLHSDDVGEDVRFCQSLVEQHGMEMLVLDQTRPDIGMPVVKVVVPGLRHFWARYAPGRLYDVPVSMGALERPTPEDALNPVSVVI
jgi:bacteriocin biosynthesis cyclodehydratase domain-containing protein